MSDLTAALVEWKDALTPTPLSRKAGPRSPRGEGKIES